jgi:hypothetical protein
MVELYLHFPICLRGLVPSGDKRFSLLRSVQTGSGAHPSSHTPRVKRLGREADHSILSSAEAMNGGAIPLPHTYHGVVIN